MSDKEPSAEAKEKAKEIVYYWRDQIAAGYEIHRDVLDDLAIDIAAALDAKDKIADEWRRSAETAMDCQDRALQERDTLRAEVAAKDAEIGRFSSAITRIRSVVGETSNMLESDVRLLVNERDALAQQLEEAVRLVTSIRDDRYFETTLEINRWLSRPDIAKILEKQKGGAV